jgi:hypothetical protein
MHQYTPREKQIVTIPNGASVSGTINLTDTCLIGFVAPSAWTAAPLTIEVSDDEVIWGTPKDGYSAQVGSYPSINSSDPFYGVDIQSLMPWRYVRFRSGTAASPVVQGADRSFKVIKRVLA